MKSNQYFFRRWSLISREAEPLPLLAEKNREREREPPILAGLNFGPQSVIVGWPGFYPFLPRSSLFSWEKSSKKYHQFILTPCLPWCSSKSTWTNTAHARLKIRYRWGNALSYNTTRIKEDQPTKKGSCCMHPPILPPILWIQWPRIPFSQKLDRKLSLEMPSYS